MSDQFKQVYVILGNHEFYKNEYCAAKEKASAICKERENLFFLDKTSILHHDSETNTKCKIVGCTLWSHIPPENEKHLGFLINDYHLIQYNDPTTGIKRLLSTSDTNRMHREEVQFIQQEIENAEEPVLVMTHRAPLNENCSHPRFKNMPTNCAFETDLSSMMNHKVKQWMFGHTHFNSDQMIGATRVISNQKGYKEEGIHWNPNKVFQIE